MTSPHTLKVWDHDNGEEPDEPNAERYASRYHFNGEAGRVMAHGLDPEIVARNYAEYMYREDHPHEQTIHVRDTGGNLHRFLVTAEPTIAFTTREIT
jgi:hypothetical protein